MLFLNISKTLAVTAVAMLLVGAGCSKQSSSAVLPNPQLEQLRQPPAATAPTKEPAVPQEAAKIPRPY